MDDVDIFLLPSFQIIPAQSLAPSLRHLPVLRHLCMSRSDDFGGDFGPSELEALAPCLSLLTGLRHLDFKSGCYFGEDYAAVALLSASLARLTGLQHLAGVGLGVTVNQPSSLLA